MPPKKPKPPAETKAQLMEQVRDAFRDKNMLGLPAVDFLLNFFTAADLVGIRDELKGESGD